MNIRTYDVCTLVTSIVMIVANLISSTVNVDIFAQYIFLRILCKVSHVRNCNVNGKMNHNRANRINCHVREKIIHAKDIYVHSMHFVCASISYKYYCRRTFATYFNIRE